MRILVLQETDWLDRNPILHHRMLESLVARGHEILVIDYDILWSTRPHRRWLASRSVHTDVRRWGVSTHGVTVVRPAMVMLPLIARLTWLWGNARELRRLRRDWPPDVVVGYGISNAWLGQQWAKRMGVPFVHHVMDALHTLAEPAVLATIARPVERAVLGRADRVIAVNNALGDYVQAMGAVPAAVCVIPMGTEHVAVDEAPGSARRSALGIGEEQVVLLFMGWLYAFSGLRELALRLRERVVESPDVVLLVVGDGDLHADLLHLARDPRLEGRLIVTGRRPAEEMPSFVAASDLCLLPALNNATMRYIVPAKVVEYMQAARPVLATSLPGLRAEFGDAEGMIWVRDPDDLLDRVAGLGGNAAARRAKARELGKSVHRMMGERPDWVEVTDAFEETLVSAVLDARSGPL